MPRVPTGLRPLLRAATSRDRGRARTAWCWSADVARQPRLGREARLRRRWTRCRQPQGDRADARDPRDVRGARPADGHQRQHRPAREPATRRAGMMSIAEGARLPRGADRDLRRHRRRPGVGVHDETTFEEAAGHCAGDARRCACRFAVSSRSKPDGRRRAGDTLGRRRARSY